MQLLADRGCAVRRCHSGTASLKSHFTWLSRCSGCEELKEQAPPQISSDIEIMIVSHLSALKSRWLPQSSKISRAAVLGGWRCWAHSTPRPRPSCDGLFVLVRLGSSKYHFCKRIPQALGQALGCSGGLKCFLLPSRRERQGEIY